MNFLIRKSAHAEHIPHYPHNPPKYSQYDFKATPHYAMNESKKCIKKIVRLHNESLIMPSQMYKY